MEQKTESNVVVYPDWITDAKENLIKRKTDKRYKEFCVLLCEMILNEGDIPEGWECDKQVFTYVKTKGISQKIKANLNKYRHKIEKYQRGKSTQNTDNQDQPSGILYPIYYNTIDYTPKGGGLDEDA